MSTDPFVQQEWKKLCKRVKRCATYLAGDESSTAEGWLAEAQQFESTEPPSTYAELLHRVADAVHMVADWRVQSPIRDQLPIPVSADETQAEDQSAGQTSEKSKHRQKPPTQAAMDDALDDSFPASDAPSWTRTHI